MVFSKVRPGRVLPCVVCATGATAIMALAGWLLGIPALTSILPGLVSMKGNVAIGFMLLAGSLYLAGARRAQRWQQLLALAVTLLAVVTLLEYALNASFGIDEALFRDPVRSLHPGRMAPISATNFMLLGLALLLPAFKWSDHVKEALAIMVALSSTFALVGYLYGVPSFYGAVSQGSSAMALLTGVDFVLLALGLLFVERETGFVRVFHGPSISAMVARYIIPVSVLVPVGLGALFIHSRASSHQHLMALSVVSNVVLLVGVNWFLAFIIQRVEAERDVIRHQAETDRLTGIYNRRYFETSLEHEIERVRRYGSELSLILFDVDEFKQFNDRYGHLMGDKILKRLVRQCEPILRASDVFCRYGGEEFAIIAPETNEQAAMVLARRVRERIERMSLDNLAETVTVSLGAARWEDSFATDDDFIAAADSALYLAKNSGRNRECLYSKPSAPGLGS